MTGIRRQDGTAFTVETVRVLRLQRERLWARLSEAALLGDELPGAEVLLAREPENLALAWSTVEALPIPAPGVERAVVTLTLLPLGPRTRVVLVVGGLVEPEATALAARLDAAIDGFARVARA